MNYCSLIVFLEFFCQYNYLINCFFLDLKLTYEKLFKISIILKNLETIYKSIILAIDFLFYVQFV